MKSPPRRNGSLRKKSSAAPSPPRRTRQEHANELAQDYAEMIAELITATGEARVIDLARRLGVTHVTVGLTDAGRKLAQESRHRHLTVLDFLRSLGVPESVAQSDAEGIEHHVSKETLTAFRRHLGKVG
jgi:DtxR family manganese transport transcriptional regulator